MGMPGCVRELRGSRYRQQRRRSLVEGNRPGSKNWLFVGSEQGSHTAAAYFSLMATCPRRGVEPFAYLARVFRELPPLLEQAGGEPSAEKILTLLP